MYAWMNKLISLLVLSCISPLVLAQEWYGNAQTDEFRKAVSETYDDLTEQEKYEINRMVPEVHKKRFYVILGSSKSITRVFDLSNTTTIAADSNVSGNTLSTDFGKKNKRILEVAVGYIWDKFRADVEWLHSAKVKISGSVYDTTQNIKFENTVSGTGIAANLRYDIWEFYEIKLYASGILTIGLNKGQLSIRSDAIPTSSDTSVSRLNYGFGLGLGARYNLFSKLYLDIGGRYINLGKVRMETSINNAANQGNSLAMKATRAISGFGFKLMWLI